MTVLEQLVRRQAKRITRDGVPVLCTDGDPVLLAAFAHLGWSDPREDVPDPPAAVAVQEAATVRDAERAVLPPAKGHTTKGSSR